MYGDVLLSDVIIDRYIPSLKASRQKDVCVRILLAFLAWYDKFHDVFVTLTFRSTERLSVENCKDGEVKEE